MSDWLDYTDYRGAGEGVVGTIKVLKDVYSPQLDNTRDLLVYLPPSYEASDRRYPVLYMHDGQNLFDPATSFAGEWGVDQTLEALSGEGIEAIVVGLPNMGEERANEYAPFFDERLGEARGDEYIEFIVGTVKPRIDADLRTRPEREATGVLGSSLGGLISLYAFFARPDVFGVAGLMSPALWVAGGRVVRWVEGQGNPGGRLYLDVGALEGHRTVGEVRRLRGILEAKGYREGETLGYVVDEEAGHNEAAWAARLQGALRFLLGGAPGVQPG